MSRLLPVLCLLCACADPYKSADADTEVSYTEDTTEETDPTEETDAPDDTDDSDSPVETAGVADTDTGGESDTILPHTGDSDTDLPRDSAWDSQLVDTALLAFWPTIPGCANQGPPPSVANPPPRTLDAASPGMTELAADLASFSVELHKAARGGQVNLVMSGWTVAGMVATASADAGGSTASEIDDVMAPNSTLAQWRSGFGALSADLLAPWGTRSVVLERGAGVFHAPGYGPGPNWQNAAAPLLVELAEIPFAASPDVARSQLNDWVFEHTACLIPELLPQGLLTAGTRSVVIDALGVLAPWEQPFEVVATVWGDFELESGGAVSREFVQGIQQDAGYAEVDDVAIVRLHTADPNLVFTAMMPQTTALSDLETGLDGPILQALLAAPADTPVDVAVPKLELRSRPNLGTVLAAVGLGSFTGTPDLGDFCPGCAPTDFVHEAVFVLDEQGIRAAAASGGVFTDSGGPQIPVLRLDRPFLFAFSDRATGAVLFLGRVGDPTQP